MTAVFAHDHKFGMLGRHVYTTGSMGDFLAYTAVFGPTTLIARSGEIDADLAGSRTELTNPDVRLAGVTSFRDLVSPRRMRDARRAIKAADHVIVRLPSLIGSYVAFAAMLHRKPLLIEVAGCAWDSYRLHSRTGRWIAGPMWCVTRVLVRRASHVVYVTERFLQRRYPTRGRWWSISNVALWESSIDPRQRTEPAISTAGPLKLGTAGAVDVPYKGHRFVVEALAALREEGIEAEYHLAGPGSGSALEDLAVRAGLGDRLRLHGVVKHGAMPDWFDSLDVYLQPSLTEGLPRALIEAMSRGLPAAGSDVGGIPELLPPSRLFRAGDPGKIAAVIRAVASSDPAAEGHRNRDVTKRFARDVIAARRREAFEEFRDAARV